MTIKQQQGSFLLEFLISLAIFSIAIIGLVKLQNRSISDLGDLGSDMAIPILISDFTARINISSDGKLDAFNLAELEATANAMLKTISVSGNQLTIIDINNPSKKGEYTVVLDNSRVVNVAPSP